MRGKRFVYGSYRGRRSTTDVLKTVALILAVLVVLAVAGVWMAQKYIVYDDGGYHLELPFFQKEGPAQEPEDFRVAVEPAASQPEETPEEGEPLLAAVTVPLSAVEDGSAEALAAQAGANSVLLDMKTDRGQLGFVSQLAMAASAGVNAGQADINRQLQALNSGNCTRWPACPASGTTPWPRMRHMPSGPTAATGGPIRRSCGGAAQPVRRSRTIWSL